MRKEEKRKEEKALGLPGEKLCTRERKKEQPSHPSARA